jgi:hypothetical protein
VWNADLLELNPDKHEVINWREQLIAGLFMWWLCCSSWCELKPLTKELTTRNTGLNYIPPTRSAASK